MKRNELFNQLMEESFNDGQIRPGFSGIGSFVGKREGDYSDDERVVLNHFFTNLNSNVYCASDNIPSELWGLLVGQYARTHLSAKDRLIELFNKIHEREPSAPDIGSIADLLRGQKDISKSLTEHLAFAGRFIDEYGVDYGHASLRDSGTIRICFDGVSQRATKFLESAREGAYQEKSTRAVGFGEETLAVPFELRDTEFEPRVVEFGKQLLSLYDRLREVVPPYLDKKYHHLLEESDKKVKDVLGNEASFPMAIWDSVLKEKAFDVARSLLPQFSTTSLAITLNTRRFQDQLTEWQSSPFLEMRLLGRAAQIEAMKISPTLMKYGNSSDFYESLSEARRNLFKEFIPNSVIGSYYANSSIQSNLISHTPEIEELVLTSILFNDSNGNLSFKEILEDVKKLSDSDKRKIAESQFNGKRGYELVPKVMEVGSFIFERFYDIGAFRDLQRQRGDRQQVSPYSVIGYHMPEEVAEVGLESEFELAMLKTKQIYDDLIKRGEYVAAEYIPVMANLVRHVVTKDPVQCMYEAKLRSQSAGADSYRSIAIQEIEQVLDIMPAFRGLVEFDKGVYPLNRLPEKVDGFIRKKLRK
ncbi:MAG TPA: FAD-dependent thymidylate synthase [Candidatus Nanoarchaeia archaeon]|nr:FAD-dependent thymidylate synthase [Candidatus Nanoarchaeia archaeon]